MAEDISPSGYVGTKLKRATDAEATGTHGEVFMQDNLNTVADKIRYLNDDGTTSDESVIAPTLLNSWENYGSGFQTVGYYKDRHGIVHLRGMVKNGTIGDAIFTLPSGYRPTAGEDFANASGGEFGSVGVRSDGNVVALVGVTGDFSLAGIHFRAGV